MNQDNASGDFGKPPSDTDPPAYPETLDVPAVEIARPQTAQLEADPLEPKSDTVPVVGLGGSAGSLEALQTFFANLHGSTGYAYVIVTHLAPEHDSSLPEILQRSTSMPVSVVCEPVKIQPDNVYVISPGKLLSMTDGVLQSTDMTRPRGRHVTVDLFLRTLADTHGVKSVAVILSGGDGDGAIGIKRVKERGGLTISQEPSEAIQPGMPRAAIATGMVDWVLPVSDIPSRLIQFRESGTRVLLPDEEDSNDQGEEDQNAARDEAALRDVLAFLNARAGHDFSYYKRATILRRLGRRMQINGTPTLGAYHSFLRIHPGETGALLQDLLISVTNFFRDKQAFAALEEIIPELFKGKSSSDQVRIWVPACATGEEAYSLAILLHEHAAKLRNPPHIQIFASDLDQEAINVAREGRYPLTIAADVSEERLKDYFSMDQGRYRIRQAVRECVLFAHHDLLRDSPFSRLDMISCRNLLIYLNKNAQARAFDIFHFALRPDAYLFLGSSESAEDAIKLFSQQDKKHRIFSRKGNQRVGLSLPTGAATLKFAFTAGTIPEIPVGPSAPSRAVEKMPLESRRRETLADIHQQLIGAASPASVVITLEHDVIHVSEAATEYLRIKAGDSSMNILRLIHPDLRTDLRAALFRISKASTPVTIPAVPLGAAHDGRVVDISVHHAPMIAPELYLVTFRGRSTAGDPSDGNHSRGKTDTEAETIRHLEEEVDHMRTEWKETVEQYEASTEELKASNEELQAMNEELRSTTEELETGREELQSINEEVITINQELKSKVEELSRANSDLQNLMASTKIATVFLNRRLQIKRYTPSSTGLFNFIPSDLGRPLSDLTHRLDYPEISSDADQVLQDLAPLSREVRDLDGKWFLVRILPYRTTEDQIAGVVITCLDISERKEAEKEREWLTAVVESSNDAIISFDAEGTIVSWNKGAERIFGYTAEEVRGKSQAILAPPEKQDEKRRMLELLSQGHYIDQFETIRVCNDGRLIDISLSVTPLTDDGGRMVGATAIAQDITARKLALAQLKQAKDELEQRVNERTAELRDRVDQLGQMAAELTSAEQRERKRLAMILHDHLQQLLVAVKLRVGEPPSETAEGQKMHTAELVAMLDEAIENSRSLAVELSPPILCEGLGNAIEWLGCTWFPEKYRLEVDCQIQTDIDAATPELRDLTFIAAKELVLNVIKHAGVSKVTLTLAELPDGFFELIVADRGRGFDVGTAAKDGTGLQNLRQRLNLLGGCLEIVSSAGGGVRATVRGPTA